MNVVLNTDEVNVLLGLVSAQLIDQAGITEAAKKVVRQWRRDLAPGTATLEEFTERLNTVIGNSIDERTRRMMHTRGQRRVKELSS